MKEDQKIPTWNDTVEASVPTWDDTEDVKKKDEVGAEVSEPLAEPITSDANSDAVDTLPEQSKYSEEDIQLFDSIDQQPRLLMGADDATRKKYIDYKEDQTKIYEVSDEERNKAKELLVYVNDKIEETDKRFQESLSKDLPQEADYRPFVHMGLQEQSEQTKQLRTQKRLLSETKRYLNSVAKGDEMNAMERFWEGAKTIDLGNVVSAGLKDMFEAIDVNAIGQKLETEGVDALSQEEKDVLVLNNLRLQAESAAQEDRAFAVGAGIAETVPFIVDIALTSGVGAGVRGAVSGTSKNILRRLAGNLSASTTQALLFPSTYEQASERMTPQIGFNEELQPFVTESGEPIEKAFGKALANNTLEVFSEVAVGQGLQTLMNRATKKGIKLFEGTKISDVLKYVDDAAKNSPILKMSAIQSPPVEFAEEIFTGVTQPLVTGDGSPKDFFERENMIRTALITTVMSSAMALPTTPFGIANMMRVNKGKDTYGGLTEAQKSKFNEAVMTDDIEVATKSFVELHDSMLEGKSKEDIKSINGELDALKTYWGAINNAKSESGKIKGANYQLNDRVYINKETFFKEVEKAIQKGVAPIIKINNDEQAVSEYNNIFGTVQKETVKEATDEGKAQGETIKGQETDKTAENTARGVTEEKTPETPTTETKVVETVSQKEEVIVTDNNLSTTGSNNLKTKQDGKEVQERTELLGGEPKVETKQASSKESKGNKEDEKAAEAEIKPIRQLGTGSNVYYESDKYRVNDLSTGGVVLNINDTNGELALNVNFDSKKEAVAVADRLQKSYPNGVPDALLVDRAVEYIRKDLKQPTEAEISPVETLSPEKGVSTPTEKKVDEKAVKTDAVNSTLGKVREYNKIPKNQTKKRAALQSDIQARAKELGYGIGLEKGRMTLVDETGKEVSSLIPVRQSKKEVELHKTLGEYDAKFSDFVKDVLSDDINLNNINVGLSPKSLSQAIKNVREGKKSVAANTLLDALEEMQKSGNVTFKQAAEGVQKISLKDFNKSIVVSESRQREKDNEYIDREIGEQAKALEGQGIKPKHLRDVYKAGREIFGLNRVQALAQAVVVDRVVDTIAKMRGVTKDKVYGEIEFRKSNLEDLSKGAKSLYQAVWHGSPYEFDKFRLDKIGTGEGAQAFGWGLYFTDKRAIAEGYAKNFGKRAVLVNGKEIDLSEIKNVYLHDMLFSISSGVSKNLVVDVEKRRYEKRNDSDIKEAIDYFEKNNITVKSGEKNLYKVKLHGDRSIDEFNYLRWDKSIENDVAYKINKQAKKEGIDIVASSNQEEFDEIVNKYGGLGALAKKATTSNEALKDFNKVESLRRSKKGEKLYEVLQFLTGSDKEASLFLLRAGIDGIKYPTESTFKGSHEESFNYVIFDENVAEIEDHIKFQRGQGAKGAIQFLADGSAIVHALTDPNVSTPLHEIAHLYEKYMTKAQRDAVLKWTKQKAWNTDTSEKFARGFEKYLADGVAPNKELKALFDRFKKWLTEIYNGIIGSEIDFQLNDAMAEIYSSMLGVQVKSVSTKRGRDKIADRELQRAEKLKEADDLIASGLSDIADLLGVKKSLTGEERAKLIPAILNIANGLSIKLGVVGNDLVKAVMDTLTKSGIKLEEDFVKQTIEENAKKQQGSQVQDKGTETGKERGTGDSNLSEVNGAELQDGKETEKEVSRAGARMFTPLSKVPIATQKTIKERGLHLYTPTSLEEANQVAGEMVANLPLNELQTIILKKEINGALWEFISVKTMQRLDNEIAKGNNVDALVEMQMTVYDAFTKGLSGAGLVLRASQHQAVTDYLAPITWVKNYIKSVKESMSESEQSKWFKSVSKRFEKKIRDIVQKTVTNTVEDKTAQKAIKTAQKKVSKPRTETSKKRSDILSKWQKSIDARKGKVLYQSAKVDFDWTEEDLNFAREIVQTYIEDEIYNRAVIVNKLRGQFDKLGISVSDDILENIIPTEHNGQSLDDLLEEQQLEKAAERLAGRIFGEVIDKKAKEDPLTMMVNTLMSKFREREKAPVKEKKSDLEKIVIAIQNFNDYKEVWDEARIVAIEKVNESKLSDIEKEFAIQKIDNAYDQATKFTFTENQVRGAMRQGIKDMNIDINDIVKSHLSVRSATRESLRQYVVDMSGLEDADAAMLSEAIFNIYDRLLTDRAKTLIATETKKMSDKSEGKKRDSKVRQTDSERLLDLILLKAFEDNDFRNAYASVKGIPQLNVEHVKEIERLAELVRQSPSTQVKRMRKDDLLLYIKDIEGVPMLEILDTLWYGSVLSGITTQLRNTYGAFGNVLGMLATDGIANPFLIPDIIKGAYRGAAMGKKKGGVILRTGKQFFENRTDAPSVSEKAAREKKAAIFASIAYLMRWMSANDQVALSIGKESVMRQLALEHLDVNTFKKMFSKKYRNTINAAIDKLLSVSKEDVAEVKNIVEAEATEFNYTPEERTVRYQELIDERRPLDMVAEAETAASRATGNTKAYGTLGFFIEKLASMFREFTVNIDYKGKKYAWHPLKLAAAFTKISSNVATFQLSFTPIGFINALVGKYGFVKKDSPYYRELSPRERRRAVIRATVGTLMTALIWSMLNPDDDENWLMITANGTGDYKDDAELKKNGWYPYSVYFGGIHGTRIPYRYSPFALMLAPLGYMSDHKKYVPEDKKASEAELVLKAAEGTMQYMADNTPLKGMMTAFNDLFGAASYGIKNNDVGSRMFKVFSNMIKGFYAPGISRNVIDTWDYFTRNNKPENNKFYNDYMDRTVFEIFPHEEDKFPARDAWGLPMPQVFPLEEFLTVGGGDAFAKNRSWHYEQGAGTIGVPNRKQQLFGRTYSDGTIQYLPLSRNNKTDRFVWNEIYLKTRGEKLREAVIELKASGLSKGEYVIAFDRRKQLAGEFAKAEANRYFTEHPLPLKEKDK